MILYALPEKVKLQLVSKEKKFCEDEHCTSEICKVVLLISVEISWPKITKGQLQLRH